MGNPINLEFLFEFQSLLNWASSRLEISSILVNSSGDYFSEGLSEDFIKKADNKKLLKIREELNTTQKLMINAPATIIFDLKLGAQNIALELAFAADLRLASQESQISLNNLTKGFPLFSSTVLVNSIFNRSELQNLLYYTKAAPGRQLHKIGFLIDIYDSSNQEETVEKYLKNILNQSPLSRVQTKFLMARHLIQAIENSFGFETGVFNAACATQEWKSEEQQKTPLKDVKKAVKMTLIHGGTDQ